MIYDPIFTKSSDEWSNKESQSYLTSGIYHQQKWSEGFEGLNFCQIKEFLDDWMEEAVDRKVNERINEILEKRGAFEFRKLSMNEAKKETSSFIIEKYKEGIFQLSVLDIVLNLRLPAEQVEDIMEGFKKARKVKELWVKI